MSRKREAIQLALELLKPTPSATQLNDARNVLAGALVGGPRGESLRSQCDRLARFIIENCAGYPQGDESATDAAIRIIRAQKNEIVDQRKRISEATALSKDWTSNSSDVAKLGRDMLGEGFTPNQNETVTVAAIRFIRELKLALTEAQAAFEKETATVRQVLGEEIARVGKQRDDLWGLLDDMDAIMAAPYPVTDMMGLLFEKQRKRFAVQPTPVTAIQCEATTEISYPGKGTVFAYCLKQSGHKDAHRTKGGIEWNDAATIAQPPPVSAAQEHAAAKRCINCNLTQDEHSKGSSRCARFREYPKPCPYAHPLWRWVIVLQSGGEIACIAPSAEDALAMFRVTDPSSVPTSMRCTGRDP